MLTVKRAYPIIEWPTRRCFCSGMSYCILNMHKNAPSSSSSGSPAISQGHRLYRWNRGEPGWKVGERNVRSEARSILQYSCGGASSSLHDSATARNLQRGVRYMAAHTVPATYLYHTESSCRNLQVNGINMGPKVTGINLHSVSGILVSGEVSLPEWMPILSSSL